MRGLILAFFVVLSMVGLNATEVGPKKGFSRTVTFDHYDAGATYTLHATPQSGWHFVDEDTDAQGNWHLGYHDSGEANSSVTVDDPLKSPTFLTKGLDGNMVTGGPGPGHKHYWSLSADVLYVHSGDEYERKISAWGSDVSVSAVGGKDPISWTVSRDGGGSGNLPSSFPDGRTVSFGETGGGGENPVEPGTYTVAATDKDGLSDSMKVAIVRVDLDVDSNNDGTIDGNDEGEDEYEKYAPGVIVCKDREGDNMPDHLVQLKIRKLPDYLQDGTLTLGIPQGFENITVWKDAAQMERVGLPKTYNVASDTIPETLYIDGNKAGNAILDLTYKSKDGVEAGKDEVAIYVAPTIAWSPSINHAKFWEPCEWAEFIEGSLASYPADTIFDGIKDEGWKIMAKRYRPLMFFPVTGSVFGDLTLSNFKGMNFSGFVLVYTHGQPGYIAGIYAYDRQSIVDWIGRESNMETRFDGHLWYARVYSDWLLLNWSSKLNKMKAITVFASCSGAAGVGGGAPEITSNMAKAGGRVQFGYNATINTLIVKNDMEKLLDRMNGRQDNATKRLAKDAFEAGGFDYRFRMYGNSYTTLCPSPIAMFPTESPGERKGWGCVVFDTYMMNWFSASQAVTKVSGSSSTSNFKWVSNGAEAFCVGFDFDNQSGGGAVMRANADKCEAAGIGDLHLDGDGIAPNQDDKEWSY